MNMNLSPNELKSLNFRTLNCIGLLKGPALMQIVLFCVILQGRDSEFIISDPTKREYCLYNNPSMARKKEKKNKQKLFGNMCK